MKGDQGLSPLGYQGDKGLSPLGYQGDKGIINNMRFFSRVYRKMMTKTDFSALGLTQNMKTYNLKFGINKRSDDVKSVFTKYIMTVEPAGLGERK